MARSFPLALAVFVASSLAASPAAADSHACAGHSTPRWIARTLLAGSLIPLGIELQLRSALCVPLRPWDDEWLDLSAVEIGVLSSVSPVYVQGGGYLTLTPSNLVSFRFEALGWQYWSIPLEDGTGYYALPTSDGSNPGSRLRGDGSASGWTVRALVTLQAHIPVGSVAILLWDTALGERTAIGPGPFFVNLQIGLVQRAADLIVGNDGVALLEIPVAGGPSLRIGAYDALRAVTGTGVALNQLGGLFVTGWSDPIPEIHWLEIGVRLGGVTNHPIQAGDFTFALWSNVEWDLGGL